MAIKPKIPDLRKTMKTMASGRGALECQFFGVVALSQCAGWGRAGLTVIISLGSLGFVSADVYVHAKCL